MKYRLIDANGDYVFGKGDSEFLVNSPSCVAQAIQAALGLTLGEWFLDVTLGVPYMTQILGAGTMQTYDAAIQIAILNTQGVSSLEFYASGVNPNTRAMAASAVVNTNYGQTVVSTTL